MIATLWSPASDSSLPPLGGGLVSAYRLLWGALVLAAVLVLGASLIGGAGHPAIMVLRLAKGAVVIAVCTILIRRRRDDPVAALLSLAFLTWTITSSFDFNSAELLPRLLDRLRFLLFALALLLFPDGGWRPGWTRGVAAASVAVFALGIAETLELAPTRLFLPLAIGCIIAAVYALIARFRTAASESLRQQLKWVALGLVAGIGLILSARAGAALSAASPRLSAMAVLWEAMFQTGIVTIALGFLVSLLRYRLFDAETAISRSAAYAGLTIALVATFAGTEAAIEWAGEQYLGMGIGNVSAAMAAAVAAVLLNPFHARISDWAEHRFQRDLVQLKRELPEVLADLSASASPRQLGAAVLPRIASAVHATRAALIAPGDVAVATCAASVKDVKRWLLDRRHCGGAEDPLFPVRLALRCPLTGRTGWLLLGPRPDGSLYGKDDLEALEAVSPAIRHALSSAAAREQAQRSSRRQWQAVRRYVSALETRVQVLEGLRQPASPDSRSLSSETSQ